MFDGIHRRTVSKGDSTERNSQARGAPVTESGCPTIVDLVSDRDDCPVTQQAFAAVGRPDIFFRLNVTGRARLPEYLGCLFETHAEQMGNLVKFEPGSVLVEPSIDFPAARRANILYGPHRACSS